MLSLLAIAGCQTDPATGATTQSSLATVTTQSKAALDTAVEVIHVGIDLKLIDGVTYCQDIDPVVTAGQTAVHTVQADAIAGYVSGVNASRDAVLAAVEKLPQIVNQIQAKAAQAKKTK